MTVDPVAAVVQVNPGITLDPGGIGKGLAADFVVSEAMAAGAMAAAVLIGGDGRVASVSADRRWSIEIAAPSGPAGVDRIEIGDGAVATSGCRRDHLIDPASREFVRGDRVVQVSVLAGTGASAEALTKAVLLGDDPTVVETLDRQGIGVLTVGVDGRLSANRTWRREQSRPVRASERQRRRMRATERQRRGTMTAAAGDE